MPGVPTVTTSMKLTWTLLQVALAEPRVAHSPTVKPVVLYLRPHR